MHRVFINYRTADEASTAVLVETELSRRFGSEKVFRDSKSIRPGDRFPKELLRAVWRSDALVAVIGNRWLDAPGADGGRALDDENDWIRTEIREAFEHDLRVIPLLVNGAPRLSASMLPEDMAALGECQSIQLDVSDHTTGINKLAAALLDLVPGLDTSPGPGNAPAGHGVISNISGGTVTAINTAHGPVNSGSGTQYIGEDFRR